MATGVAGDFCKTMDLDLTIAQMPSAVRKHHAHNEHKRRVAVNIMRAKKGSHDGEFADRESLLCPSCVIMACRRSPMQYAARAA